MSQTADGTRHQPRVDVQFDRAQRGYDPGDTIHVRYDIRDVDVSEVRCIEHSLAWYTEGKGEEDLYVHFFERLGEGATRAAVTSGGGFFAPLPPSPLSYEGLIVKVRWCARVRLFFKTGRDFVSEHEFELGRIPAVRPPARAKA